MLAGGVTWGAQRFGSWVERTAKERTYPDAVRFEEGDPRRIQIASLGVDAPMVPLGVDRDGRLDAPEGTDEVGWFRAGPEPGEIGTAIVAGHLDSRVGPAVFADLPDIEIGATIAFEVDDATVTYRVTAVEQYAKDAVPDDLVHRSTGRAELRLITCGGEFDTGERSYRDNVVVFADFVSAT